MGGWGGEETDRQREVNNSQLNFPNLQLEACFENQLAITKKTIEDKNQVIKGGNLVRTSPDF